MATPIQLGSVGPEAARHQYSRTDVRHAVDGFAAVYSTREVYAVLLKTAADLTALSFGLTEALMNDSFDPARDRQAGLYPHRRSALAEALTCVHNAVLFLQEAQRCPDGRTSGYDPLTTP